ncbi:histidine triad nucleotide-binding protein [Pyruvatibacter sp.]|uniref:histidine triad nucleotide-binding protein n=1 Tax=Pyruvatibacter sp. TaxID=1981328 RepID=UPI0032F06C1C
MADPYDHDNIFAKILRDEIPAKKVYEDIHALAFHDINPQAPVHVLVIPKGPYVSLDDFLADAPDALVTGFFRAVGKVSRELGIAESEGGTGFRAMANAGSDAHQEVPHLHIHLFGGKPLGPMLVK